MARTTPEQWQEKHARRLKASTEDIKRGVMNVEVSPGKLAAEAKERLIANFIEAVNSGNWEKKVAGVSLQEWQDAMINKGAQRIAAGVDAAKEKSIKSAEKLLRNVDTASAEVKNMPKGTIDDSIARASHYMRRMKELSK